MWGYHIGDATTYLAITGVGIDDVKIAKKAFVKPFQKVTEFSIAPIDITLKLQAMTLEKLSLLLPAVFTIGPCSNDIDELRKYASLLTSDESNGRVGQGNHVEDIVRGIIEGETRVIVSGMTMEEIFKERQLFKSKVIQNVQSELDQFGLKIYNANVKELQDTPGSEYFAYLSRKAHESAHNQAKVDVAEARMRGEIGERQKQGQTKQEVSKIEAETSILETQRKKDKAKAEASLQVTQTDLNMDIQQAQIRAKRAAEARDAELCKDVEKKKAEMELERRRATDVVASRIARETAQQKADAEAYTTRTAAEAKEFATQRNATASLFNSQKTAEADQAARRAKTDAAVYDTLQQAEAAFHAAKLNAEADFLKQKKQADGMVEMAKGYSAMADALGGPEGLMRFMMIDRGVYKQLADANAGAVRGMQPKINVWTTGGADGAADPLATTRDMFRMLPPLFQGIEEQTGYRPPQWMADSPQPAAVNGTSTGAQNELALPERVKKALEK